MYKISVPIINRRIDRMGRENLLAELKRLDAERVFLSLGIYPQDEEQRAELLRTVRENCAYFKAQGLEVGVWYWTFWMKNNTRYTPMRSIKGTDIPSFMCPADENFLQFATDFAADLAACGVDIILFDDDFRYTALSDSPACLCKHHLQIIRDILGEDVTLSMIKTVQKYMGELGDSEAEKMSWRYLFTSNLKALSGAVLHKTVFSSAWLILSK